MGDRMDAHRKLILVTEESRTISSVASALGLNGQFGSNGEVCPDLGALAARLDRAPATAVLLDIDPQPAAILKELDLLSRRFADTRFFVLSNTLDSGLLLEAMRAGARQFLLKPSIESELAGVLERFAPDDSRLPQAQGAVITVLSASGGCGSTTLAVNLASELHLDTLEPVLLVDRDADYGAIGPYLGLQGRYGLGDVLAHKGQIDPQLITSTALSYSNGLHALLSPASINFSRNAPLEDDRLDHVLEAARRVYAYTVVDAPRVSTGVAAALARSSLFTLVVLQLTIKDIKMARTLLADLSESGLPAGRLIPLVNRHRSRHGMVTLEDARKAIGGFAVATVTNDFRGTIAGINYGQPLSEAAPRSAARKDIKGMAGRIIQAASEARVMAGAGSR